MLEVHGIPVQGGETGILESIISVFYVSDSISKHLPSVLFMGVDRNKGSWNSYNRRSGTT